MRHVAGLIRVVAPTFHHQAPTKVHDDDPFTENVGFVPSVS